MKWALEFKFEPYEGFVLGILFFSCAEDNLTLFGIVKPTVRTKMQDTTKYVD